MFGKAYVCSDTEVKENCLPVADSVDFLLSDPVHQVHRERFYFLFTFWLSSSRDFTVFLLHAKFMYLPKVPIGHVSVSNLSSLQRTSIPGWSLLVGV